MAVPVILDVDTGIDDAMALMLAGRSDTLNILGVTCVAGNVGLDQVVENTLTVLDVSGRDDVLVAAGYDRPLLQPYAGASDVHGMDGLADLGYPRSRRQPVDRHAVDFIASLLRAADEPVTLIALAPLTNIAGLVRRYPELLARVGRILCMGGAVAVGGNVTAAAEFNIWGDPEAAAIVFASGVPLTMYGLDVFYEARLTVEQVEVLAAAGKPWSPLLGGMLHYAQRRFGRPDPELGDAGLVAVAILPEALTTQKYRVDIELNGAHTRGMTVVDRRHPEIGGRAGEEANVDVGYAIDGSSCARLFVELLS